MEAKRSPLRMAYLLSQYPAVNHVFMLREVCVLRKLGLDIQVASIRNPDRDAGLMTTAEQAEARSTYYVKSSGLFRLVLAHVHTLVSRPGHYIRGLASALRNGSERRPRALYGLFYFTEAVAVGYWMGRHGLSHVHTHYASTVGFLVGRIFPVTLSIAFHGPVEFQDPAGSRLAEKVRASLFCCAISQYGVSQMMYACGYPEWPKLELTTLGVDPNRFQPRPFRPSPSPFQIICVGRLAPVKGLHLLIWAMAALVKEGRHIRLRFAGDGPERVALRQDVENRGLSRATSSRSRRAPIPAGQPNRAPLRHCRTQWRRPGAPTVSDRRPNKLSRANWPIPATRKPWRRSRAALPVGAGRVREKPYSSVRFSITTVREMSFQFPSRHRIHRG